LLLTEAFEPLTFCIPIQDKAARERSVGVERVTASLACFMNRPAPRLDLGEFGGLVENCEACGIGSVGLCRVGADLGDLGSDVGPL
jgi:hypothetical protein